MSLVADGPLIQVRGRGGIQQRDRVRYVLDDLRDLDDADMVVGNEGDRPPALAGAVVEDDRPRLGDRQVGPG